MGRFLHFNDRSQNMHNIENQDNVWSSEQIIENVFGYYYFGGARTVDVHVRRLRAKLGDERKDWIKTVHSVGYKFN